MLVSIDRPLIDARNIRGAKVYTNETSNPLTIEHENKAVVIFLFNSGVNTPTTDTTTAIADGTRIGQTLRIVMIATGAAVVSLLTIKNNANTKLLGEWSRIYIGTSAIPSWLDLVWDGEDWQQQNTNDGTPGEVSGTNAHGEGLQTVASGIVSHAEGQATTASGQNSHSQGLNTVADGQNAHAEGVTTTASGNYSHAEGGSSEAIGSGSHAQGGYSKASLFYQHAQGGGNRSAVGDAQFTRFIMKKTTSNGSAAEMISPARFTLGDDKLYACRINIAATKSDLTQTAWFNRMVLITRGEGANDVTKVAEYAIQDIGSNGGSPPAGWAVTFTADDANDSLKIEVTGAAATTIYWVAVIECVEVA